MGGRGFAARLYWEEVPPGVSAFSEDNRLIFAVGPLAGVPVIGGSRWGVYGKSPIPAPHTFSYSNLGGRWGAELKFAGYDGLVIWGKADKPVYLILRDGEVAFKDASALWGKGAAQTREAIKRELGSDVRVVAVGPAGENLVAAGGLLADADASGSAGLGAIMGAKRLKAIAVKGSGRKVNVAHPETLKQLTGYLRSLNRGSFTAWGTDFVVSGPKAKKDPCYGCQGKCLRIRYTADDGTSGKFVCQSSLFYQQWAWRYYGQQTEAAFHANRISDDYGLDTWFLEQALAWLYRCHRAGLPAEQRLGLQMSQLGSVEFIESLVKMIALRQGFGDALAQGLNVAARLLGGQSESLIKHPDPYEPRLYLTTALLWAVEPREPIQALHEVGYPLAKWTTGIKGAEKTHVDSAAVRAIAKRFWGSEAAADFTTTDGKALAAKMIQDRQYVKESLILCDWIYPISDSELSPDHVGDPSLESRLFSAVTGIETDEVGLYRIGEAVFNQQRAAMIRDGRRGREDDRLPEDWHNEPLKRGVMDPECLVPDREGKPVSRVGAVVDRQEFERMKDEYYAIRGWNSLTGLQTRRTLEGLGLKDVADDLEHRGLLGQDQ
ncbi:MAG: aldehyde ferredoxin oxidoreductase N-terminal domain-containing protein [Dehalococcoidia bacterium]|nr:aldehyde ferredoxin oxidoreductase N-terminal domain-containing protein [Dehalococcoidia bacterium]